MTTRRRSGRFTLVAGLTLLMVGVVLAQAQLPGLWTPLPPLPLPTGTGVADHTATLLGDGTILIAGGEAAQITLVPPPGTPGLTAASLYQPSQNGWFPLPNMATDRASHGAAVLANGTSVLVAGGYNLATAVLIANLGGGGGNCGLQGPSGGAGAALGFGSTNAELFDETTFGWTVVASMNSPRAEFTLVRLPDGRILAPAGSWKDQTAEIFDPTANTWSYTGGMNAQRAGAATTPLFDGRVFVAGGNFGYNVGGFAINCPTDAEVYDPNTNSWSGAGGMSKNHYHATAIEVRVADGTRRVLVAGGFDGDDSNLAVLQTTELWDPSTNSFTQAAPMLSPRAFHTATLLQSGQVLVTGGLDNTRTVLNTTEIYDPVTNTWTAARNMSIARAGHTATMELGPGPTKVVVVGGISTSADGTVGFVSSAELFQPTPISSNVSLFPTQTLSGTFNESSCGNPGVQAFVTSSTGIGTPTGQVTFKDGGTPIGTLFLSNGQATLNVPPLSLGTHTLQATYNGDSAFTASTSQILTQQVVAPPIQVSGPPTSDLGSVTELFASVPDGATGPFNFTWTPPSGTLLDFCTRPGYFCGVAPSLGPNVFTVTGTDSTGCHLGTGSFTVNVLPTHFGISVPSSVVAGMPFNLILTALDSSNRVDTTYTGTAHFTSTDPQALPAPDYTFFPADAGVHIFSATLKTVGTQTIIATDTAFASITGTSGPIQVNAPPPDFSIKATSPINDKVGGFENSTVTVTSLNGFNSPVALSTSNLPSGVTTTFSTNPVTPPSGGSATSTLTVTIGPSVTPTTFTFTVTGISGALTHSAQITVAVTATPVGVAAVIANMAATTTCIDSSGISNALSSKLSAAQSSISAGDVQSAINTLTALKNQIQAQAGKHIATSCSTSGVSYNPASTLLIDVQNLIDTTRTSAIADPIIGYVLGPNGAPVSGATVSLLDSGGNTIATAATDITGFYYFATTGVLTVATNYSVQVTGLAGFTVATPSAQPLTWQGAGLAFSFSVN